MVEDPAGVVGVVTVVVEVEHAAREAKKVGINTIFTICSFQGNNCQKNITSSC